MAAAVVAVVAAIVAAVVAAVVVIAAVDVAVVGLLDPQTQRTPEGGGALKSTNNNHTR